MRVGRLTSCLYRPWRASGIPVLPQGLRIAHRDRAASRIHARPRRAVVGCQGRLERRSLVAAIVCELVLPGLLVGGVLFSWFGKEEQCQK
jgi:hypothetical protein